jgi:hypothetical protein
MGDPAPPPEATGVRRSPLWSRPPRYMPSLIRFLVVVGVLAGLVYGGLYALATFVEPKPREMTIRVPPEKFER